MLEMFIALVLVAIVVGIIVVMTPDNNSACTGNCRQGRNCDCTGKKND
jgi:hypothetical protein